MPSSVHARNTLIAISPATQNGFKGIFCYKGTPDISIDLFKVCTVKVRPHDATLLYETRGSVSSNVRLGLNLQELGVHR